MLLQLSIRQMGLIDQAEIAFEKGLNILSGETGAGKTILIQAISLTLGQKADSSVIRTGADKATVEAVFDAPYLDTLLDSLGIETGDFLMIKREIVREGKSRSFINSQQVPLSTVQTIGAHLFEMVSQNAQVDLKNPETQLQLIDQYGGIDLTFLKQLKKTLSSLHEQQNATATDDEDMVRWQLTELTELNLQEGEEKALEETLKTLTLKERKLKELGHVQDYLSEDHLSHFSHTLEGLSLKECADYVHQASLLLSEASYILSKELSDAEFDPSALVEAEERLSRIHKLQKKYGDNLYAKQAFLEERLAMIEKRTAFLEKIDKDIKEILIALDQEEKRVEGEREKASRRLESAVSQELNALNMKGATFLIREHQFFLSANTGEAPSSLREGASGGELCRLLFIIKLLLKESVPTLIFDEIDANIGGETASLFAAKLKILGKERQVIAITHFPQVATEADHHLKVHKEEVEGRTFVRIAKLDNASKAKELLRMLGGKHIL